MEPDRERLEYLFGDEAVDVVEAYDLGDESDLREVIERFLPLVDGSPESGARLAIRQIAVTQILADDPPATWQAVVRMRDAGLPRDRVLGQLAMVISDSVMEQLATRERFDAATLVDALEALPVPSSDDIAAALLAVARAQPDIVVGSLVEQTIARFGSTTSTRMLEPLVEQVLDHLLGGPVELMPDDTVVPFHDAIAGRTFTHRVNDAELDIGMLAVSFDLAAFTRFAVVRLPDGNELEQFSAEAGHLGWFGPDGWLDGYHAGDLLAVTAEFEPPTGDELPAATVTMGVLADEPAMTEAHTIAIRAAYDEFQAEDGMPVTTDELVIWLCHHHSDWFSSPLPPLLDWCDTAGLDVNGNSVAHDPSVWRRALANRRFHAVMDLVTDTKWRMVVGRAVEVLDDPDATVEEVRTALSDCAEPDALDVLVDVLVPDSMDADDEFVFGSAEAPGRLFELVGRATAVARRPREVAVAEYLACVLRERCGQPLVAAEHLARALDAQPRLGPIVERMGWYCFDRGDARGAMRWWRELDEPHPGTAVLEPFVAPSVGRPSIGRNDPCWCGSGRKFKQCHLMVSDRPALPDRVAWLCRKAWIWLEHSVGEPRQLVSELAVAFATGDPEGDVADLMVNSKEELEAEVTRAFDDPILAGAALHEGGLFGSFLRERGELLPHDERLLAAAWLTVDRSVHEVVAVEPGTGMTLRDLATGEVVEVRERAASRTAVVGERYCARVVPDGASHQLIDAVFPVRTGHEERVMALCADGDPREVCAWVGALAKPLRIERRQGMIEEMFDMRAIEATLDELGEVDEATMLARLSTEFSRQAQARWLDEHVPALGGLTPREAAGDPTRREQLERLLAEFDRMDERVRGSFGAADGVLGGPITYDTAALRRELGLT